MVLAISIFNTILLLWLGLTVLLNAERRTPGVWIAGAGLLMGSLFFLNHTAILSAGPLQTDARMNLMWQTGWIPVVTMPYAWYLVMLWYSSFWDDPHSSIRQRHQIPLILATLLAISTVGLILIFNALPSYNQAVQLDLGEVLAVGDIPILMVVYPIYLLLCMGFSLDVLLHPGMPVRLMGQLARQRARPWLQAATLSLLFVSLSVGAIIMWGIYQSNQGISASVFSEAISIFDLAIDVLLAITIISIGQAIISYEIFTGKILPRQGLKRYWYWAIVLSLGYAVFASFALVNQFESIYLILISIFLITGIYALVGWHSFVEKENHLKSLRPFLTSQHLYDQLIFRNPEAFNREITNAFHTLCKDVLGIRQAYLVPLGIFGPLAGTKISFPERVDSKDDQGIEQEIHAISTSKLGAVPQLLPGSKHLGQNPLAIALWSERGLIGMLILGDKQNAGLFTQEEIDIARTVGERLIDSKATNELTHRLMQLERQHLAETRVVDQQTRRTLHDDILPRIHSLMIKLSGSPAGNPEAVQEMGEIHHQLSDMMRNLPAVQDPELAKLGLVEALKSSVAHDFEHFFNTVTWQVSEGVAKNSHAFTPLVMNVIYHATREAVRNSAHHGRLPGSDQPINLCISMKWRDGILIEILDDGIGFNPAMIAPHADGHGMSLHSTLMAIIGGSLAWESIPGKYTKVTINLPV
ncbi:MAG: hypothetical protein C3F13_12000 [Anaerolineales bacterium]|nr:MAG: hypothetical protein C3F13_12000 [Anaerolineales bacterium]